MPSLRRLITAVLLLGALARGGGADPGEEWPSARGGARRSGASDQPVLSLTAGQFGLAWRRVLGAPVAASPIIARDRVVVADTAGVLHAVDAETGWPRWTARLPAPVLAAATRAGDVVLVPCSDGTLTARRLSDGTEAWQVKLDAGIEAAPAVRGARGYVASRAGTLYALDVSPEGEGRVVWQRSVGAPVFAPPALGGHYVAVLPVNGTLQCLTAADGTPRWKASLGPVPCYTAPVIDRGEVVVVSGAGVCAGYAATDGTQRYRVDLGVRVTASPMVQEHRIAVVAEDGSCRVLDREDGSALWHRPSPFNAGPYRAGIVAGPDWMFVASARGRIHIKKLDAPYGSRTDVHPMTNDGRPGSLRAGPALHRHGFIGVRADGLLFAYREAAGDARMLRVILGMAGGPTEQQLDRWVRQLTDPIAGGAAALALCRHGHAAAEALARRMSAGDEAAQAAVRRVRDHLDPFLRLSGVVRSHLAASRLARQRLWRACLAHRDPAIARAAVRRWAADSDAKLLQGFDPSAPVEQRRAFVRALPR